MRHAPRGLARAGAEARRRPRRRRVRGRAAAAEGAKGQQEDARYDKTGPSGILFSEKFACPVSGFTIPEIEPRLFSFNNPFGACPKCGGLGVEQHIDADLVIPDKDKTLQQGRASRRGRSRRRPYYIQTLQALGEALQVHARHQVEGPAEEGAERHPLRLRRGRDQVLLRRRHAHLRDHEAVRGRHHQPRAPLERETESDWAREEICEVFPRRALRGLQRLPPEARGAGVKIGGLHIGQLSDMSIKRAGEWFSGLPRRC